MYAQFKIVIYAAELLPKFSWTIPEPIVVAYFYSTISPSQCSLLCRKQLS